MNFFCYSGFGKTWRWRCFSFLQEKKRNCELKKNSTSYPGLVGLFICLRSPGDEVESNCDCYYSQVYINFKQANISKLWEGNHMSSREWPLFFTEHENTSLILYVVVRAMFLYIFSTLRFSSYLVSITNKSFRMDCWIISSSFRRWYDQPTSSWNAYECKKMSVPSVCCKCEQ